MIKIAPFFLILLLFVKPVFAQKKSELFTRIDRLETELDSTKAMVAEARKNEKASEARAVSFESQVTELQAANNQLLGSLKSFTQVSKQNSETVEKTLVSLKAKEAQLAVLTDGIAQNDSTALVVLTNAKQTLGENAKISVSNGSIVIHETPTSMFGMPDGTVLSASGKTRLQQIANILTANSKVIVTLDSQHMALGSDTAMQQVASLGQLLQDEMGVTPNRIMLQGTGNATENRILLKLHPNFEEFYYHLKEGMKN